MDIEQKAIQAVKKCLEEIPFVDVCQEFPGQFGERNAFYDFIIRINSSGTPYSMIVEVKNSGEPRYARQASNQLVRFLKEHPDSYGVFIAPYISDRSAKICSEAGIGYVDFAGNCHLSFEKVYIHTAGKPNPYSNKRVLRSLYSPKAERILRVLLANGPKKWKVEELSGEAGVSFGLVAKVKDLLLEREWIKTQTVGFSLTEPFSLLQEWAQNYQFARNKAFEFYTLLDVSDFEYRLGEVCNLHGILYGLTGFSGGARFAPAVRYQRATAYVNTDIEWLINMLELRPVPSGSNVILLTPYDNGVFYQSQDKNGVTVISSIQIYLDLLKIRGRGEEAAQAILEKAIRPKW